MQAAADPSDPPRAYMAAAPDPFVVTVPTLVSVFTVLYPTPLIIFPFSSLIFASLPHVIMLFFFFILPLFETATIVPFLYSFQISFPGQSTFS